MDNACANVGLKKWCRMFILRWHSNTQASVFNLFHCDGSFVRMHEIERSRWEYRTFSRHLPSNGGRAGSYFLPVVVFFISGFIDVVTVHAS
jgi:hypothetical protein